jgi:hypothetical protein
MHYALVNSSERVKMAQSLRYGGVGIILVLLALCMPSVYGQEEAQLRLVAVDTTAFPIVSITLLTVDARSAPADLSGLSLRENGAPITDLTFTQVPSGVDVTFVLDANAGFDEIDDDTGLSRREKSLESIRRFARLYMNPDGLDTVSIVVPDGDGQNGRFLISEVATADDIEDAISSYEPQMLGLTPLNAMVALALEQAQQRKDNSRYQAILLFTDGRRLDQQLSFPQLVAQANDANAPIYSAILGKSADPNEIANVLRLNDPTRAFYVHMPEPSGTDPIYQIWQEQSNPMQVQYRSRQRQSGRNQLTLNLGSALISTSFEVILADPEVELFLDNTDILRAGIAPDTPLNALQPAIQPVAISVKWPDGLPRQLSEVTLLVDGQPKIVPGDWQDNVQGEMKLDWDISRLEEGSVELTIQVMDELGYQGISKPVVVNITIDRPLLPTPIPTAEPQEPVPQVSPISWLRWDLLAGVALVLFLVLIALLWRKRRASVKDEPEDNDLRNGAGIEDPGKGSSDGMVLVAALESFSDGQRESIPIRGDNVTVGSQAQNAQIVLEDASVGRLHARIRRQDHEYWLFDEGGSEGTYLNYKRLGLAPQKVSDGDIIQFGRVSYRFRLRQVVDLER